MMKVTLGKATFKRKVTNLSMLHEVVDVVVRRHGVLPRGAARAGERRLGSPSRSGPGPVSCGLPSIGE
jgi:hypothetical protein